MNERAMKDWTDPVLDEINTRNARMAWRIGCKLTEGMRFEIGDGRELDMPKCKTCGADIVWAKMETAAECRSTRSR